MNETAPAAVETELARAIVWQGGGDFESIEVPLPVPGPGEALVRLTAATVCGSDRHTVSGRRQAPCPSVLGHEGVGRIVTTEGAVAVDGEPLKVGDRVVFSVTSSCHECEQCLRGLTAKCERLQKVGHEAYDGNWPLSGTYASHILLPNGVTIAKVPDSVPDRVASTVGCAVATVMAVLERAGDLRGRRVLVNGLGMLGIVGVAAARAHGAAEVLAVDLSPERLTIAERLGATAFAPGEGEVGTLEVALELSGAPAGIRTCIDHLGIGGVAVLAGSVAPIGEVGIDPEWLVRGWRSICGVHNYEPRHLQEAVEFLVAEGESLPWDDILDGPISASDIAAEFERSGPMKLRTVLEM